MNPLDAYPHVRRALYLIQWVTTGITTVAIVGFLAAGVDQPTWFNVSNAVLGSVWMYTGITAQANVTEATDTGAGR